LTGELTFVGETGP